MNDTELKFNEAGSQNCDGYGGPDQTADKRGEFKRVYFSYVDPTRHFDCKLVGRSKKICYMVHQTIKMRTEIK